MTTWWDRLTPWDTEAERKAKEAAQAAAGADAVLLRNRAPVVKPDSLEQWATDTNMIDGGVTGDDWSDTLASLDETLQAAQAANMGPQPQPENPWSNSISAWRQQLDSGQSGVPDPEMQVGTGFDVDTGVPDFTGQGMQQPTVGIDSPMVGPQPDTGQEPGFIPGEWLDYMGPAQPLVDSYRNSAANERAQFQIDERNAAYDEKYGLGGEGFTQRTWGNVTDALDRAGDAFRNNAGLFFSGVSDIASGERGPLEVIQDNWRDVQLAPYAGVVTETAKALPGAAAVAPYTEGLGNKALNVADTLQATSDYALGQEPADLLGPGLATEDVTVGGYVAATRDAAWAGFKALYGSLRNGEIMGDTVTPAIKAGWNDSVNSFREALQPTVAQLATMTPDEIERSKQRAALNWADYRSVEQTFDALVDQRTTAAQLADSAAQLYEQGAMAEDEDTRLDLWRQSADLGAQAYALENTHPVELVNQNTNLGLQLITELLLPDITDLAGGLISLAGQAPRARRLTRVTGEVMGADRRALDELAELAVGPQARAVVGSDYNPYALWKGDSWWTTGEARANIAVDQVHRYLSQLVQDVDTSQDMRIILRQLAADPRKLITGMDVDLFQSEALLQRATDDGLVRFGSMNLANAKEPLRILGNIVEEFTNNADSLTRGPLLNKIDFVTELHDNLLQAGRKFYNVATDSGEAQKSWLGWLGSKGRQAVSPFYIYTSPGTWATNIIGGAATALGDGTLAGGRLADIDTHLAKLYNIDATTRGFAGVEAAQSFAQAATGTGGILAPIKKAYGAIDEYMGKRVYYKSVTHALQRVGKQVMGNVLEPLLRANGVTDAREIKRITNHMFEVGYSGGNLVEEFTKLMGGRARVFSLTDANGQWLDALDPDSLSSLYEIVRRAPDKETALAQLTDWYDDAVGHWQKILQEAPVTPQRHAWQAQESAQDMADIAQIGNMAAKHGVSAQEIADLKRLAAAGIKETQANFERLAGVVAEMQDPANRYLLYDIWGRVTDITTDVRSQLAQLAEQAYHVPVDVRNDAWRNYFDTARDLWTRRNESVNDLLSRAGDAITRGEDFTPNVGQWDILERTARKNEQKLWDTLRLEPQSGAYDKQLTRVIEAGRSISDRAIARVYAAARRFNTTDAIDHIISAERNAQMAGAQARAYLDRVLEKALNGGSWEDYYSIRNEVWRQVRAYERAVWGIAERQIVADGLSSEIRTGLRFDAGPDGVVELIRPETRTRTRKTKLNQQRPTVTEDSTVWFVRREDGTTTTLNDNYIPDELKERYNSLTGDDFDAEVELELDNIASAVPFADAIDEAGQVVDGYRIPKSLDEYWEMVMKGEEPPDNLLPQSILDELDAAPAPRSAALDEQQIAQAEQTAAGSTDARAAIRGEWDRVAKANGLSNSIDQEIATFTRNGIVNVPENRFEDLYGSTVAGRRIESQEDVNALLQEYYDLSQQAKQATADAKDIKQAVKMTKEAADRIAAEMNLGAQNAVKSLQDAAKRVMANTTQAGGAQAPELALAAQHASDQVRNIYNYVAANIDEILTPKGVLSEGQALRAVDDFRRQVLPAWDNAKYIAAEYGNRMRSFTMVDFANNTRLDELAGVLMPYSFWMTRSIKNSLERAIFEPHIWARVQKTEREIGEMQKQEGDPNRYNGSIPVDLGNGMTYYLRLSPAKYWPTFGLFTQNDYADPESANNALSYAVESLRSGNAGLYPWFDLASKVASNKKDGKDALEDIYPMSYIPQGRLIGWVAAKYLGYDIPWALRPGYYEYNVGRELTTMVSEGLISAEQAQWAQDMLRQMRTGEDPLPEQAAIEGTLTDILQQATTRAANKELLAAGTSFTTGIQVKPFDQDERQAMEAIDRYNTRGYDAVENQTGSELAMNATYDDYPELGPRFSQGSIYQTEKKRPGIRAVEGEMWDRVNTTQDQLYTAGDDAVNALITSNPNATKKQIEQARLNAILAGAAGVVGQSAVDEWLADNENPYYPNVVKFVTDAIKAEYPSAGTGPDKIDIATVPDSEVQQAAIGLMGQMQVDAFMRANPDAIPAEVRDWVLSERGPGVNQNPVERVETATDETLKAAEERFPYPTWPGDDATKDEINAYYTAKDEADANRATWVEGELNRIQSESGVDPKLLVNSTGRAASAYDEYKNRYKTDLEIERLAEIDAENEAKYRANQEAWTLRRNAVTSAFGEDAGAMWDEYYSLPKGSDARKAYMQAHPEMKLYNLAAYNPDEYAQAVELFGNDALMTWVNTPPYADNAEARAARNAYYDENPQAWAVNAWVWGRPGSDDEVGSNYNFGVDYNEAVKLFGDDIWTVVNGYRRGWDKNYKRAYYDKYPQLSDFFDWWYGNSSTAKAAGTGTATGTRSGSSSGGGGGGGFIRSGEPERPIQVNIPMPYTQGLSRELAQTPMTGQWRPSRIDTRWLEAARNLAPGEPRETRINWIRKV